ncbi:MAG: 2-C-methyl-D-erythritol 4-phosphate cytidylyltransferase [Paludibacteraceae bacterium]|nr:2-C-methyl-D-erythritol 4-phosphate cytidylyltransferase [Paludibacteraceae bacterium]
MDKYIIIVAGGKGLRMGGDIPKQFLPIGGRPVLMRTIDTFVAYDSNIHIIIVLPIDQQSYWKSICKKYGFNTPHLVANGGETRFHSVKNGLALVPDNSDCVVGVHDGVRPFASLSTIREAYDMAIHKGTAIPVTDCVDSLRRITTKGNKSEDRSQYKLVQTPQVFKADILHNAYKQCFSPLFTDDASVVENTGHAVELTQGNRENIKLTTPFDLMIAEALIKSNI